MRFLCLHGRGTSARIFKSQTASFRALLPKIFDFDFVDGPYRDTAAPGVDLFYSGPYYQWYPSASPADIKIGQQWILKYIEEHGPYDGVMNFSQGCALTSSLLLSHQKENPDAEPLFKVAVFICGGVPLDYVADLGIEVSAEARKVDEVSRRQLTAKASNTSLLKKGSDRWGTGYSPLAAIETDKSNVFGINFEEVPRDLLIPIPTVHVYGSKDPRFPASVTLAHFCEGKVRREYNHGGGHDIPRRSEVSEMLAELIQWCGLMASCT